MSIWGNRDKESSAEEAPEVTPVAATPENYSPTGAMPESESPAGAVPESGAPDAPHESDSSAEEPAPAFWRAQGRPMAPGYGRAPGFGQPADEPAGAADEPAGPADESAALVGEPEPVSAPSADEPVVLAHEPAGPAGAADESAALVGEPEPVSAPSAEKPPAGTDTSAPVLDEDVVVLDAETAAEDPGLAETPTDPAETAATVSPGSISPQRWSEIMVAFVDDPRGSVKMAADAVDSAIEEIVTSVRGRQQALASAWQGSETDTEQLRSVLREYRRFGSQIQQMGPAEPTGGEAVTAS